MNVLLLLLLSEPVWITTSTPPISSDPLACTPANEYLAARVKTATDTVYAEHFAGGLMLSLDKEERQGTKIGDENKELRETNQAYLVWIVALAATALFVGVGGAALW